MKATILKFFALLLLAGLILSLGQCGRQKRPQYILIILMDAVRPDHLSCYGYERTTTPNIDELAGEGILFENAVSQAPWTLPSLATILSSTFPSQHGASRVAGKNVPMKSKAQTFVELLAANGYKTCAMSTARLFVPQLGLAKGFGESYIIGREPHILEKVAALELSRAAIDWLSKHRKDKCFLFIHHYDTHYPYKAEEPCVQKFNPDYEGPYRLRFGDSSMRILKFVRIGRFSEAVKLSDADVEQIKTLYDCEIVRTDKAIGMLIDSLGTWGCLDRSMIFISADHGEEFLERGSLDHGQSVYDESIRVPLVLSCPSLFPTSKHISTQVGLIDIAPTILHAVGIDVPQTYEGTDLIPIVRDNVELRSDELRPCGLPRTCLVSESLAHRPEKKALRLPPWKLIYDPFFGAKALYNLESDPGEIHNFIKVHPDIASNMTDLLVSTFSSYWPGGWCIAWRGSKGEFIRGSLNVAGGLIEVVAHGFYPDFDAPLDSLTISHDNHVVSFKTRLDATWKGVEVRMPSDQRIRIDVSAGGKHKIKAIVGKDVKQVSFPAMITPGEATVDRRTLDKLFDQQKAELVIFWLPPGTEPTAKEKHQAELKRKPKALGYID